MVISDGKSPRQDLLRLYTFDSEGLPSVAPPEGVTTREQSRHYPVLFWHQEVFLSPPHGQPFAWVTPGQRWALSEGKRLKFPVH